MVLRKSERFGLLKTLIDAHTMGINSFSSLLEECGYEVVMASKSIEQALENIGSVSNQNKIIEWITENKISYLGFSYRLDTQSALNIVGKFVLLLKQEGLYEVENAIIKKIFFAGMLPTCDKIDEEYGKRIVTFRGGESVEETLTLLGIDKENIPVKILDSCKYDQELLRFGQRIINEQEYKIQTPLKRRKYNSYGTNKDTLIERLDNNFEDGFQPLIRAHSGPYSSEISREECLMKYHSWCKELAEAGYLDILSIGSSQLSQSNFGDNWDGMSNGGGVPVNSEKEYFDIWKASRPMLVRTYSGTRDVKYLAEIYERNINISWHALSLWWFNELDGRGPNSLYDNLKEHISTIKYVAKTGKPFEANVSHHFAFRGCDDITYILSAYIAAKLAKKCGIKTFVLQNMLNTPRSTWGVQDLAKSRTMLKLVKSLEDCNFRVVLQTRAGLDYFKPDLEKAKVQLAAVTALMDDIDPKNIYSPEIIHVVSYSEALFLATPEIINDSIKITRYSLDKYRELKRRGETPDVMTDDILERTYKLEYEVKHIIQAMETCIPNLYSEEGLYIAFVSGWLPVPELWSESDEFKYAKDCQTKITNGGRELIDKGLFVSLEGRINKCISHLDYAEQFLNGKYNIKSIL